MTKEDSTLVVPGTKLRIIVAPQWSILLKNKDPHNRAHNTLKVGNTITVIRKENHGRSVRFFFSESRETNKYVTLSNVDYADNVTNSEKNILNAMATLSKRIELLYAEQSVLKQKMAYIKLTGSNSINEKEFKAYLIVQSLEEHKGKSSEEKAKILAKLM